MKSLITVSLNVICIAFFAYATYAIGSHKFLANVSEEVAFTTAIVTISGTLFAFYALIENIRNYFKSKK